VTDLSGRGAIGNGHGLGVENVEKWV
jgi:hypothetical protein